MREVELSFPEHLRTLANRLKDFPSFRKLPSVVKSLSNAIDEFASDEVIFAKAPESILRMYERETLKLIQRDLGSMQDADTWFTDVSNFLNEMKNSLGTLHMGRENLQRERAEIRRVVVRELNLRSEIFSRGEALNESMAAALSRLEQLESALAVVRREAADAISVMENEHRATFTALEVEASGVLGAMQGQEKQARALLQYVGDQGASAGYDIEAAQSRGGRRLWQFITIVSFVAWIIWQAKAYSVFPSVDLSLPVVLRSFLGAMPFALLTGFGVLQVARFSAAEERNRRAQLEIFAMEPLLTGLEVADQKELRKLLIPHFYRSDSSHGAATAKEPEANGPQLLQRFLDLIGKK